MKIFSVSLDESLIAQIRAYSKESGLKIQAIVSNAIKNYIKVEK
jgi:hypothetical protein